MRRLVVIYSPRPDDLGVQNGQLRPCPDSPNCVSTYSRDPEHAFDPLPYTVATAQMHEKLVAVLAAMPRTTIITNTPTYVHAELRTRLMGFVDDAEFYFDEPNGVLHMRSGSRLGKGDLGVNRRNLTQIRRALVE
ncbi:MAG: DUF1499 domain-containing protein [Caldilineaceae bacterium]